jgi:hypothetical protein
MAPDAEPERATAELDRVVELAPAPGTFSMTYGSPVARSAAESER